MTVRLDEAVMERVRKLAAAEGISLNKAAIRLLRAGAGLTSKQGDATRIGDRLDAFIGTWSEDQANDVLETISACDAIDEELWR